MYGLPERIDLSFFRQRQLEQVCLGEHQVQMRFDGGVSIDLEAEFTLDGERCTVEKAYLLHRLIGLCVNSVAREGVGDIRLRLGDHVLLVHDSNAAYESYTIHTGVGQIVV